MDAKQSLAEFGFGVTVPVPFETICDMMDSIPPWSWWRAIEPGDGGAIWVLTCEDENAGEDRRVRIDAAAVCKGLTLLTLYPSHLALVLNGQWDCETVDTFLQLVAYGKVVFA